MCVRLIFNIADSDFDVMNELEAHGISVESELFHTGDVSTDFLDETFVRIGYT